MKFFITSAIFALIFLILAPAYSQNTSNEGNEFWVCFPDHVPSGGNLGAMSIFITSKSNSSGVVSCGSFSQVFTVQANTVKEVLVPRNVSFIGTISNQIVKNKGIKVLVDAGKPKVVVYAHVFAGFRSEATLVLPINALGAKHYAMSYTQIPKSGPQFGSGYYSQFDIVAVDPNTKVNITPVVGGVKKPTFSITLVDKGDVYQYQADEDITSSYIEVDSLTSNCKRIAVFSGSSALALGSSTCDPLLVPSLDPLLQQLYPLESWGKTFPLVPFYDRNAGSIFRVIASDNNTSVLINGKTIKLNKGEFYSSDTINTVSIIKADKPISVAQFALTQNCADSRNVGSSSAIPGDPDMVILNPLEYSIDKITMYSSVKQAITEQYLNVTIPSLKSNSFRINNVLYSNSFKPIPANPEFSYAQISLTSIGGSNFSLAADTGFNAVAYGFGPAESYAYSAGTSLAATNVVNAVSRTNQKIINIACVSDQYDFRILLPYIPTKLVWKLDPSIPDIVQENPTATQIKYNGKDYYEFKLTGQPLFTTVGVKPIKIIISLPPNSGTCSTIDEEIIDFDFEVSDLPVADFTAPAAVCQGSTVNFTYVEKNIGKRVTGWQWDFGDGSAISTLQNPTHVFTTSGVYNVKLALTSEIGCVSNVLSKQIFIAKNPTVNISFPDTVCVNNSSGFLDLTSNGNGTIVSREWNFGDSTAKSTLQNPIHSFTKSGVYNVTLKNTTEYGCVQNITKSIVVVDPPQFDFSFPNLCLNDTIYFKPEILKGNIKSWLWDFGDGTNDLAEKVKKEPKHHYQNSGNYLVTLTATSTVAGCVTTLTKSITVNGSSLTPAFQVSNSSKLCSNIPVDIINKSTASFGNIVKLDIIFEYTGSNNDIIVTDNFPRLNKVYTHLYPASAVDKTYKIVFRAYTGINCFQDSPPTTITVHGSPSVTFGAIAPVCLNTPKFLITAAKETTGINGTELLEGEGIVGKYFDPAVAGVGAHLITYTFTSPLGCQDQKTQTIIVRDLPTVDAGEDLDILLAGQKQINATSLGAGLKVKWFPSDGLSADSVLNPIASPKVTTTYTVTVTSPTGCSVSDQVVVNVHIDPNIPNVFSPNNDGINDTWSIKYLETFVNATIKIYNRFGQQVFIATPYNTPWDGRLNGKDMPVGVYYYIIEPNNGRNKYTGSVTILR